MTERPIRLGPYELLEPLGRGGMGEVWAGRHVEGDLDVAIKLITGGEAESAVYRSLFRNEIEAVAALEHPGIVAIFDHASVDGRTAAQSDGRLVAGSPYFAMERANAGPLRRQAVLGRWPDLRDLLLALLDALAHAHARGVVHRDIKPGNVLLCSSSSGRLLPKLADFGLATLARRAAPASSPIGGTPWFMAPEQIRDELSDQGPWTDLYALGCLTWGLVAHQPLFADRNLSETMAAQLAEHPPPLAPRLAVPAGLEDWLRALLEKHPSDRFQRAADAAHALIALGDALETTSGATGFDESPTQAAFSTSPATTPQHSSLVPTRKGRRHVLPPCPTHWSRPATPGGMSALSWGLSLFGLRTIPLVGREAEREALWQALRATRATGRPSLLLLDGPAGIGKTRLARWLAERAHELGAATPIEALLETDTDDGLLRALAELFGTRGLTGAALGERLATVLARRLGDGAPGLASRAARLLEAAPQSPGERHATIHELLAFLARERPIVLVLDDISHSAEALALARLLLVSPEPLPVLLVATARDEALATRPREALLVEQLLALPQARRLAIMPLPADDFALMVEQLLRLETGLAARVAERAAGNPLFAVELVGAWVQRGALRVTASGFVPNERLDDALPDDLHALGREHLAQFLATQPAGSRDALEVAAALGLVVERDEWLRACAEAAIAVPAELVSHLVRARLARRLGRAWAFENAMLRESLEREAREAGRWQGSQRACAAMLLALPSRPGLAERLGRHLLAAGDPAAAIDPLLSGARERREASQFGLARELLDRREQALVTTLAPSEDVRWGAGFVLRARIFLHEARLDDVFAEAQRAEREAAAHGWPEVGAEALRLQGDAARRRGQLGRAEDFYARCVALGGRVHAPHAVAASLWGWGDVRRQRGDLQGASQRFAGSRELYGQIGDRHGLGDHWIGLGDLARQAGDLVQAEQSYGAALALFDELGNRYGMARSWNGFGEVARSRGQRPLARESYERSQRTLELVRSAEEVFPRVNLGLLALAEGRREAAEECLSSAERDLRRLGWHGPLACAELGLAALRSTRSDWDAALELIDLAADRLDDAVDPDLAWLLEHIAGTATTAGVTHIAQRARELARLQSLGLDRRRG